METVFSVKDMNCGHCTRRIEEAPAAIIAEAGYTPVLA